MPEHQLRRLLVRSSTIQSYHRQLSKLSGLCFTLLYVGSQCSVSLFCHSGTNPSRLHQARFVECRITRVFGMVVRGKKTLAMVPVGDMLIHDHPGDVRWGFNVNKDTLTALSNIRRGQPITESYGRKCNARYFTLYGFTLNENLDNEVVLHIPQKSSKPIRVQVTLSWEHSGFQSALQACRNSIDDSTAGDENVEAKITREISALKTLRDAAGTAINAFETSIEEDNELLSLDGEQKLDLNERNCVVMRRGKKMVEAQIIGFVDKVSAALESALGVDDDALVEKARLALASLATEKDLQRVSPYIADLVPRFFD